MAFRCGKVFVSYSSSVNPRLFHFTPHQNTQIFRSVSTSIPRCTLRTEKGRNFRGTFVVRSMSDGEILFNFPSFTFHQMNVVFFLFLLNQESLFSNEWLQQFSESFNIPSLPPFPNQFNAIFLFPLLCLTLCNFWLLRFQGENVSRWLRVTGHTKTIPLGISPAFVLLS